MELINTYMGEEIGVDLRIISRVVRSTPTPAGIGVETVHWFCQADNAA
jgi:hypothetical protein